MPKQKVYNASAYLNSPKERFRTVGRVDAIQAADILGFEQHDIAVLIQHGLLSPLANPVPNARKYFAAVQILELAANPQWLGDATHTLYQHWQDKNSRRCEGTSTGKESVVALAK